jgi:AraC family transcriptional regulator
MSIVDKAVWIIERNSDSALSLNGIAHACGVSRAHLARAFGSATGLAVMQYLRARRLSQAAQALANGAPDILAVALDAGYSSHEAFTRAFREHFSITPERVREQRSINGLAMTHPLSLRAKNVTTLQMPTFAYQASMLVVGLAELCSFATTITIPAQWQRFMAYYEVILHKARAIPVGISQAPDDEGMFRYLCGVEVTRIGETPVELELVEIVPRRYAVFEHTGHISALYETYTAIWNEALPAIDCEVAEAPVLERHNPQFDPATGEGGVTVWIPLTQ